jgi:hypothetical protein
MDDVTALSVGLLLVFAFGLVIGAAAASDRTAYERGWCNAQGGSFVDGRAGEFCVTDDGRSFATPRGSR